MKGRIVLLGVVFVCLIMLTGIMGYQRGFNKGLSQCPDCNPDLNCPECPEMKCPEPVCPKPICDCDCPEQSQLKMMAENVADEHKYRDEYNCHEHSKELVRRLKDAGYDAEMCLGKALWCNESESEYNCWHNYVKVEDVFIEAVTGELLAPRKYEKNYDAEWCRNVS